MHAIGCHYSIYDLENVTSFLENTLDILVESRNKKVHYTIGGHCSIHDLEKVRSFLESTLNRYSRFFWNILLTHQVAHRELRMLCTCCIDIYNLQDCCR